MPELQLGLDDFVDLKGDYLRAAVVLDGEGVLVMVAVGVIFVPEHLLDSGLAAQVAHHCNIVARPPLAKEVQRVYYLLVLQQKGNVAFVEQGAS